MEPKLPMPSQSPEMGGYQRPEASPIAPERSPQHQGESQPASRERQEQQQHAPAEPIPIVVPAIPAQDFRQQPTVAAVTPLPANDNVPLVARDNDLIEKEWVDKAKQIIRQTRDDPYTQEKEVSRLQADYIKKRYGKDVKVSSE